jgi:hypothetical protein
MRQPCIDQPPVDKLSRYLVNWHQLSIGLLRSDGLSVLCGHLLNLATVVYFAVLILGGSAAVREAFRHLFSGAF